MQAAPWAIAGASPRVSRRVRGCLPSRHQPHDVDSAVQAGADFPGIGWQTSMEDALHDFLLTARGYGLAYASDSVQPIKPEEHPELPKNEGVP